MTEREPDTLLGLRVDVDTLRGTRDGVPTLLEILAWRGIRASFFFSVGPDNMGRHLWRLLKPAFLKKMLRSKAPSLYGWDILLRGPLWPGPPIGRLCGTIIRMAAYRSHEVGMHAWDHHAWQMRCERMTDDEIDSHLSLGIGALGEILGSAPESSAAPGWICNDVVLACKEKYAMRYHSDCRGNSIFRPVVNGAAATPQIPVTLPTYDELIGREDTTDDNFNDRILERIRPGQLNVLTIHAEVEGIAKASLFQDFLDQAERRCIRVVPLGDLLPDPDEIPEGRICHGPISGRDGLFCIQEA